jgi:dTDP-4-amino-4,6-dideoxygalactose transaminase
MVRRGRWVSVPWLGHKVEYDSLKDEINGAIQRVLESGEFQRGEEVDAFEEEFARFCDAEYAVGTASCYGAMFMALLACGVGPGDEVITVANTDIATTAAISHTGAAIVWVDIDERTYNIDPAKIEARITTRTKAILPVHMYGLPADMDPIMDIARQHDLWVIDDAALAVGARYKGRRVGALGHVGCFSFVYGKGLGAYGDAGMAVTNDATLAKKVRELDMYSADTLKYEQVGQTRLMTGFHYTVEGHSSRLMPLHAAVLREKLKKLEEWIARRREIAQRYGELLNGFEIILPYERDDMEHVYRNYTVRVKERDRVRHELAGRGIPTGMHYIPPLHLQPVYKHMGYGRGALPVTEKVGEELFTLPMYPELADEQVEEVVNALRDCLPVKERGVR